MQSRAYRRHQRRRAYLRRRRILLSYSSYNREDIATHKILHWHLHCNCMTDPRELGKGRRAIEKREWHRREGV